MPLFICKRCNYETNHKQSMLNHTERLTPCINTNNVEIPDSEKIYNIKQTERKRKNNMNNTSKCCKLCKKEFYDSSNRKKHERICKFNLLLHNPNQEFRQEFNQDSLNEESIVNNVVINNLTQNFHIHLNSFKDPIVEESLENRIRKYLTSLKNTPIDGFIEKCFPGVFNMIYFDENIPENHSISMMEKNLIVYDGKNIVVSDFDKIKSSLESVLGFHIDRISSEVPEIDEKFEEYHNSRETSENIKNRYKRCGANYISFIDQENKIMKNIIDKNSHISLETMKKKFNSSTVNTNVMTNN
jgi:hypothetical protein